MNQLFDNGRMCKTQTGVAPKLRLKSQMEPFEDEFGIPSLLVIDEITKMEVLLTKTLETLSFERESGSTYQPAHAELYAQRGVVLSMLGCQDRGMLDFHQAIALDPENNRL